MSAVATPVPAPRVRSFGLPRAETLKLRKRRGLVVTVTLLTIAPMIVAYGILIVLHAVNPAHHGPAGGVDNLGNGMSVLVLLGGIAAVIAGANAGAADLSSGVFRELVVTGRSRVALFGARIPGGLLFLLPFTAFAYTLAAVVSGTATAAVTVAPTCGPSFTCSRSAWGARRTKPTSGTASRAMPSAVIAVRMCETTVRHALRIPIVYPRVPITDARPSAITK